MNIPLFIKQTRERLFRLEQENKELRILIDNQSNTIQLIDNALSSLIRGSLDTDIFFAVKQKKLANAQFLIEKTRFDVNKPINKDYENDKIYKGNTLLHIACENDDLPLVQYLIEKKANVNAQNYQEQTPLHLACYHANGYQVVRHLIQNGANIKAKDKEGKTPLHIACINGNKLIVQFLIQNKADIEAKDKEGKSPLEYAITSGQDDLIKVFRLSSYQHTKTFKKGVLPFSGERK